MEYLEKQKNARMDFCWGVFLLVGIFLDQLSKYIIFEIVVKDRLPKNIGVYLFQNFNFAFSLPLSKVFIYLIYFFVLVGIGFYLKKNFFTLPSISKVAWVFILAGAISNIGERIYFGYVRDFIYLFSGIFNLADFYIIFGVLILFFSKERQAK
jgi:signal peptidase II